MRKIDEETLENVDKNAQNYLNTRRYDYQLTLPNQPDYKRVIELAFEIIEEVKICERLEVRDNGLVICSLRRDDKDKERVEVTLTQAANRDEVIDTATAHIELKSRKKKESQP